MSESGIKTIGLTEFYEADGRSFKRKKGTKEWIEVGRPTIFEPQLCLSLVRQNQADGEPTHWSLHIAREGEPGNVYQVKGDAECMRYIPPNHMIDVRLSEGFKDIFELATLTEAQARIVEEVAQNEPPPQAENRRSVTENCQGWTVSVIRKLVERGIVSDAKLEMVRTMVEPL